MGYQVKRTIITLKFADPDYEGMVVRCRAANMGEFLDVSALADLDLKAVSGKEVAQVNELFAMFIVSVIEWNLEDEGEPVPQTVEGLKSLDIDFVFDLLMAWVTALTGATPGLSKPSDDGPPFQEASIPMEALSPSRAS